MEDPAWETSKENVLPLKSGRSTKKLADAFLAQSEGFGTEPSAAVVFEKELSNARSLGSDVLDIYVRFFKWTRDQYPSNSTKAMQLLERCTAQLVSVPKYKNDPRFVQMWIEYADMVRTPGEIFTYMSSNKIGEKTALFWMSWAFVAEKNENFNLTDQIFQKGIKKNAEPKELLLKRYQQYQRRMARRYLNTMNEGGTSGAPTAPTGGSGGEGNARVSNENARAPLSLLQLQERQVPRNSAPIPRSSTATTTTGGGVNTAASAVARPNSTFTIFSEENESSVPPQAGRGAAQQEGLEQHHNKHWRQLGSEASRRKENDGPVTRWTDGGVNTAAVPSAGASGTSGSMIAVYVDEEFESQETQPQSQLPDTGRSSKPALSVRRALDGPAGGEDVVVSAASIMKNPLARHPVKPEKEKEKSTSDVPSTKANSSSSSSSSSSDNGKARSGKPSSSRPSSSTTASTESHSSKGKPVVAAAPTPAPVGGKFAIFSDDFDADADCGIKASAVKTKPPSSSSATSSSFKAGTAKVASKPLSIPIFCDNDEHDAPAPASAAVPAPVAVPVIVAPPKTASKKPQLASIPDVPAANDLPLHRGGGGNNNNSVLNNSTGGGGANTSASGFNSTPTATINTKLAMMDIDLMFQDEEEQEQHEENVLFQPAPVNATPFFKSQASANAADNNKKKKPIELYNDFDDNEQQQQQGTKATTATASQSVQGMTRPPKNDRNTTCDTIELRDLMRAAEQDEAEEEISIDSSVLLREQQQNLLESEHRHRTPAVHVRSRKSGSAGPIGNISVIKAPAHVDSSNSVGFRRGMSGAIGTSSGTGTGSRRRPRSDSAEEDTGMFGHLEMGVHDDSDHYLASPSLNFTGTITAAAGGIGATKPSFSSSSSGTAAASSSRSGGGSGGAGFAIFQDESPVASRAALPAPVPAPVSVVSASVVTASVAASSRSKRTKRQNDVWAGIDDLLEDPDAAKSVPTHVPAPIATAVPSDTRNHQQQQEHNPRTKDSHKDIRIHTHHEPHKCWQRMEECSNEGEDKEKQTEFEAQQQKKQSHLHTSNNNTSKNKEGEQEHQHQWCDEELPRARPGRYMYAGRRRQGGNGSHNHRPPPVALSGLRAQIHASASTATIGVSTPAPLIPLQQQQPQSTPPTAQTLGIAIRNATTASSTATSSIKSQDSDRGSECSSSDSGSDDSMMALFRSNPRRYRLRRIGAYEKTQQKVTTQQQVTSTALSSPQNIKSTVTENDHQAQMQGEDDVFADLSFPNCGYRYRYRCHRDGSGTGSGRQTAAADHSLHRLVSIINSQPSATVFGVNTASSSHHMHVTTQVETATAVATWTTLPTIVTHGSRTDAVHDSSSSSHDPLPAFVQAPSMTAESVTVPTCMSPLASALSRAWQTPSIPAPAPAPVPMPMVSLPSVSLAPLSMLPPDSTPDCDSDSNSDQPASAVESLDELCLVEITLMNHDKFLNRSRGKATACSSSSCSSTSGSSSSSEHHLSRNNAPSIDVISNRGSADSLGSLTPVSSPTSSDNTNDVRSDDSSTDTSMDTDILTAVQSLRVTDPVTETQVSTPAGIETTAAHPSALPAPVLVPIVDAMIPPPVSSSPPQLSVVSSLPPKYVVHDAKEQDAIVYNSWRQRWAELTATGSLTAGICVDYRPPEHIETEGDSSSSDIIQSIHRTLNNITTTSTTSTGSTASATRRATTIVKPAPGAGCLPACFKRRISPPARNAKGKTNPNNSTKQGKLTLTLQYKDAPSGNGSDFATTAIGSGAFGYCLLANIKDPARKGATVGARGDINEGETGGLGKVIKVDPDIAFVVWEVYVHQQMQTNLLSPPPLSESESSEETELQSQSAVSTAVKGSERLAEMRRIYSAHFLPPLGLWLYTDAAALIMPYANAKTLLDLVNLVIRGKNGLTFDGPTTNTVVNTHGGSGNRVYCKEPLTLCDQECFAVYFLRQMIDAVAFMHRQHLAHCDIKPNNWVLKAHFYPQRQQRSQQQGGGASAMTGCISHVTVCLIDFGKVKHLRVRDQNQSPHCQHQSQQQIVDANPQMSQSVGAAAPINTTPTYTPVMFAGNCAADGMACPKQLMKPPSSSLRQAAAANSTISSRNSDSNNTVIINSCGGSSSIPEHLWTVDADLYGLAACVHNLLYTEELHCTRESIHQAVRSRGYYYQQHQQEGENKDEACGAGPGNKDEDNRVWVPKASFKRHWNKLLWSNFYLTFLNFPAGADYTNYIDRYKRQNLPLLTQIVNMKDQQGVGGDISPCAGGTVDTAQFNQKLRYLTSLLL